MNIRPVVKVFFVINFLLLHGFCNCQEIMTAADSYNEDVMESVSEGIEADNETDFQDEELLKYPGPVNINTATQEELEKCPFLNVFQIAVLLEYRKKYGPILSLYELIYLPGFGQQDIGKLKTLLIWSDADLTKQGKSSFYKTTDHEILMRWNRIAEKQDGYRPIPDSILQVNPDKSFYPGSPDKLYLRYRLSGNYFKGAFIAEKDPGEEFFSGSNIRGFDYYSAFAEYHNENRFIEKIILGDYHICMGQGLLIGSNASMGKLFNPSTSVKPSSLLKGNVSTDENRFFRGFAAIVGFRKINLLLFASDHKTDATIADSSSGQQQFSGFVSTGNHATKLEISKENALRVSTCGGSLRYDGNKLKTGINMMVLLFDKMLVPSGEMYKLFYYSGHDLKGISCDYRYLAGKVQLFGEIAYSGQSPATIQGILFFPKPEFQLGILYRNYPEKYYSCYFNAFSENATGNNEKGYFLNGIFENYRNRISFYCDIFSFPWLRYRIDAPSNGYETSFDVCRKMEHWSLSVRYKHKTSTANEEVTDHVPTLQTIRRNQYRFTVRWSVLDFLYFQNRIECITSSGISENTHYGYMSFQELKFKKAGFPLELYIRAVYFNSASYDSRIYVYEQGVLYSFGSYMCYGKGWRLAGMIRWQPADPVSVWFRVAQSILPGMESTGSGLNTIHSGHKTEIKIQTIVRF